MSNKKVIDLITSPNMMKEIVAFAEAEGFRISEPMATESVSDALDSPIGAEEVRQISEVVTIIIDTGTSLIALVAAIKALFPKVDDNGSAKPTVIVIDTNSQERIVQIEEDTDPSALEA